MRDESELQTCRVVAGVPVQDGRKSTSQIALPSSRMTVKRMAHEAMKMLVGRRPHRTLI